MSYVTNTEAAAVLLRVAAILQLAGDNPYRVRAYRRAARLLLNLNGDARQHVTEWGDLNLPGLGPHLRRKLGRLFTSGHMTFGIQIAAELPAEITELLAIPGVGPRIAVRLFEELGLQNAADVYAAAQQGKIRDLYGFGRRSEELLLHGAEEVLAGRPKQLAELPPYDDDEDFEDPDPAEEAITPDIVALPRRYPDAA